ncbi:MAG TPA: ATP-dependent zinc metalloprotease FtsH [Thermoleophilaceae bacterium]|nr:ATP-dependent zinc metalloprotease FtsH [Thermoleophilaceae bacterium]
MADDASERNETRPARGSGQGQGDGAPGGPDPRTPLPPGPRDRPGWRISPAPDGRGATPPKPPMMPFSWGRFLLILAALLAVNYLLVALLAPPKPRLSIPYSPTFLAEVRADNVKSISSQGETVKGDFKRKVRYPPSDKNATAATRFSTQVPTFANNNQLSSLLQQHHVVVNAKPENERSLWETLLVGFGPTLLLVAAFLFLFRRAARAGGAGGLMSFGRSRARRVEASEQTVTFADVAGIDEAKAELTEIVDFLRDPGRYRRLGARIPRGALLTGPPGTGKTLLARAVAGEAGVPFFSISASEFIEAIVGIGASRVRDLFAQAKEAAPAIIFIDELDAIGRSRAGAIGFGGGHDEREQTLNQILTEMDGFDTTAGVIVLAASNRPEVLDPALLRPGRFDRRVAVQPPDLIGRRKILEVHTRSVPLGDDVDLEDVAASTPGMVGADLANLVNEAALLAASRGRVRVEMRDFTDALEKIVLGAARKVLLSEDDRRRVAYHEAGHAIVGMLTPGADPVRKVSIIPRGQALGVTLSAPEMDRFNYDERYLKGKLRVSLAGRAAEEIVFGDVTTGAESDIQQVTEVARRMVGRWGMSPEVGLVAVLPADGQPPGIPGGDESSEATQQLVDREVRRLVEEAHQEALRLLSENRERLDGLASALLEHETLDEDEAYAAARIERRPEERREPVAGPTA